MAPRDQTPRLQQRPRRTAPHRRRRRRRCSIDQVDRLRSRGGGSAAGSADQSPRRRSTSASVQRRGDGSRQLGGDGAGGSSDDGLRSGSRRCRSRGTSGSRRTGRKATGGGSSSDTLVVAHCTVLSDTRLEAIPENDDALQCERKVHGARCEMRERRLLEMLIQELKCCLHTA